MNKKEDTIRAYNQGALVLSKKFNEISPRVDDIQRAFSFINKENPKVLELGCGNGRDAKEILKFTNDYLGIDASVEMIKLSKEYLPDASFLVGDMETFNFPKNLDIIFAFAALLHLDKPSVKDVLLKAHDSLSENGIFYFSVKLDLYHEKIKTDEFGQRTFYYYNIDDMRDLAKRTGYEVIYEHSQTIRGTNWLTVALRKI